MPDTSSIRLKLLIGPTVPGPADPEVIDAISSVEVTNTDSGRDGFQLRFTLGKDVKDLLLDYSLLLKNFFEPPNRVIIIVYIGASPPQVLIDGIITSHQIAPSNTPGGSTLVITGEDISLQMDLEEKDKTFKNQSDSQIVAAILKDYLTYGVKANPTTTDLRRSENQGNTTQQGTDLAFIQQLASRNGFVFYVEPTQVPAVTTAYWGPPKYESTPQPALSMNMGPDTNLESLSFSFNALGPAKPKVAILDPDTKERTPVSVPPSSRPPLASVPTTSLRTTLPRDTANKEQAEAALRAIALASNSADAVTGSGQLDAVRYGGVLRARQLVGVRGVGNSYDGSYYVSQVTHQIKPGEYKQSFSLSREGRGSLTPIVTP
jgi:phage protein D